MKVLIAEDDRVSRRALDLFLVKWGYEVVQASDGRQAWEILQHSDAPKLVLLDWMMPGIDGVQLCREIRQREGQPYVYILLLTAKGQKQDIVKGLEAGADDYVVKPFEAQELRARVRVGQRILELQEQLLAATEAMRFQANHDPLTGLWNRAAILDILRRELLRSQRTGSPVGVVLVDLDHFKDINDRRGHLSGDAVLREVAARMNSAVRAYDSIGRYGGEEFLIVVPDCEATGALSQAERIRAGLENHPVEIPGGAIPLTASLGVAATEIVSGVDPDTILRAADLALYRAKNAGRNRVEVATAAEQLGEGWCVPPDFKHSRAGTR